MAQENPAPIRREAEHTERIRSLFAAIAGRYDFLNRLQSFRRDVAWRRATANSMSFFKSMRFLDLATGTGDLALDVAARHPEVRVTGVDLVEELMEIGRQKAQRAGVSGRVEFLEGNALELPFSDESFDAVGIAFGIRNIKDRVAALREMHRVLVPGGKVHVLELCYHQPQPIRAFYWLYLKAVIPTMARLFAKDPEAYIYLGRSIMEFPSPEGFEALMREAGFTDTRSVPLTFGVARLFEGTRPPRP